MHIRFSSLTTISYLNLGLGPNRTNEYALIKNISTVCLGLLSCWMENLHTRYQSFAETGLTEQMNLHWGDITRYFSKMGSVQLCNILFKILFANNFENCITFPPLHSYAILFFGLWELIPIGYTEVWGCNKTNMKKF